MANHYVEQPGRRVVRLRDGSELVMDWNPNFANRRNDLYNRAQRYLDAQVLYKSEEFIPVETGNLIQSGRRYTRIGSGMVIWLADGRPYTRPQYFGWRRRRGVGQKIHKGHFWFRHMKDRYGEAAVNETKRIAGGGNGG